ncbi:STAS/SEC14 domain-containing protein [Saccharopolyspora sp. NPDC002686]|uniref:STAS/SEC14 domain-containing protein n=1 Tax=Saccharopolyspora sp. NPDC002686 TaxID=3154541 RepID=UPI0033304DD6
MLEKIADVPAEIDAVKAVGKLSKADYETVLEPLFDAARRDDRRIRLLYQVGPEFQGFTAGAAWEDAKVGWGFIRLIEGCAVVTDIRWIAESTRLASFLLPCPVRIFSNDDRDAAVEWLTSLPEGPGVSHHIIPESGVLVVEVEEPLRAPDFEALAHTADSWLEQHRDLPGLVVHVREFPGWENITGLIRHIRFVRDHHRSVKRVALVADSKLAGLAPHLVNHFVQAEVTSFGYDALDAAIAWAAGPT